MALYYTETVMRDGSIERVILDADSSSGAMHAAGVGHREDGKAVHYIPVKRKVSKAAAAALVDDGARCWASF